MFDLRRLGLLALVFGLWTSVAVAQDDRLDPPKTPAEFWRAVQFELNTGKFDSAAYYLKAFLAANPTEDDLVKLEAKDGMASFLRLRNVATWSTDAAVQTEAKKNAEDAIGRVTTALEKKLGDATRIGRFIANLSTSPEERAFAIKELQRSGARAVPLLVTALRTQSDSAGRAQVLSVLPLLPEEAVAPILAATDMSDASLKYQLIQSLGERQDFTTLPARTELNPLPTLDFLSASPNENVNVRKLARDLIVRLRPVAPSAIRAAKLELVDAALRFYKHQAKFNKPDAVPIWRWENDQLNVTRVPATQAEEYFGLRYARWALELDPTYLPAQVAFLSIATEKAFERTGIDGLLAKSQPAAHDLLATAGVVTLIATLDQAIIDNKTSVALAAVRVLGERAEPRAAMPNRGTAGVLQRALDYPDRRVQFAAAEALAKMPATVNTGVQAKTIEVLRGALASETEVSRKATQPRVLLVWFSRTEASELAKVFATAGFDAVNARTWKEAVKRVHEAGDIDMVAINASVPNLELPDLIASLRSDAHSSGLPVRLVFTPVAREDFAATANEARLRRSTYQTTTLREHEERLNIDAATRVDRLAQGMRNVSVVRGPVSPAIVQTAFSQESTDGTTALTPEERKRYAASAIELFRNLALRHAPGYDLALADRAIRKSLGSDELARAAVDVVGRLPGRDAQTDLAGVVVDGKRPAELRVAAAENLVGHIQRFGAVLSADQVKAINTAAASTSEPVLRGKIADIVGALDDQKATGQRLKSYSPVASGPAKPAEKPAAKPMDPPAKKEEEEDKSE